MRAYRAAGADPPFVDPARAHGAAFEGYYWRIVNSAAGSVVVVLCGVCQGPGGPWAVVALAAHPGGFLRHATVEPASADPDAFGARAGDVLLGSAQQLVARVGDDSWVDLRLRSAFTWPRRAFGALGPAQLAPGLEQYWHPVVLTARAEGEVCLGGVRTVVDGATAYAEKNWGPSFAEDWWWGHAGSFPDTDATVAFAGGRLALAGRRVSPTAVVLRVGASVVAFAPPLALVRATATDRAWNVRVRSPGHTLDIEGDPGGGSAVSLPVPEPAARTVAMRSSQHLAGRMRLCVRRRGRLLLDAETGLAGLERGVPAPPDG